VGGGNKTQKGRIFRLVGAVISVAVTFGDWTYFVWFCLRYRVKSLALYFASISRRLFYVDVVSYALRFELLYGN